jgi:hypothetical protein
MGKLYEKIKQIHIKYRKAFNDPSDKNIKSLIDYLDRYGLTNRRAPYTRLNQFLNELETEIRTLDDVALTKLNNEYKSSILGLQTGDVIDFKYIIRIHGMTWVQVVADIISSTVKKVQEDRKTKLGIKKRKTRSSKRTSFRRRISKIKS